MCSDCRDLDSGTGNLCSVHDVAACHDGCQMDPLTMDQERVIAGQCCEGCGLPWAVPASVQNNSGVLIQPSVGALMRVMIDGVFQTSGTLAAFVGDEVRGVSTPQVAYFGPFVNQGTVLFNVLVWPDQSEQLTWKFCDGDRLVALDHEP